MWDHDCAIAINVVAAIVIHLPNFDEEARPSPDVLGDIVDIEGLLDGGSAVVGFCLERLEFGIAGEELPVLSLGDGGLDVEGGGLGFGEIGDGLDAAADVKLGTLEGGHLNPIALCDQNQNQVTMQTSSLRKVCFFLRVMMRSISFIDFFHCSISTRFSLNFPIRSSISWLSLFTSRSSRYLLRPRIVPAFFRLDSKVAIMSSRHSLQRLTMVLVRRQASDSFWSYYSFMFSSSLMVSLMMFMLLLEMFMKFSQISFSITVISFCKIVSWFTRPFAFSSLRIISYSIVLSIVYTSLILWPLCSGPPPYTQLTHTTSFSVSQYKSSSFWCLGQMGSSLKNMLSLSMFLRASIIRYWENASQSLKLSWLQISSREYKMPMFSFDLSCVLAAPFFDSNFCLSFLSGDLVTWRCEALTRVLSGETERPPNNMNQRQIYYMKTLGKFVLLDADRKKQVILDWGLPPVSHATSLHQMNYHSRKTLISDLHPLAAKPSHLKLHNLLTSSSTKKIHPSANTKHEPTRPNSENKRGPLQERRIQRSHSVKRTGSVSKTKVSQSDVRKAIIEADKKKGKVIGVVSMRRNGLRLKVQHTFLVIHTRTQHAKCLQQLKIELFQEFSGNQAARVYLFHLGKEPINNIARDIQEKELIIFADLGPKFNLSFDFQMRLFEEASMLEEILHRNKLQFEELKKEHAVEPAEGSPRPKKHEWEKIKDVNQYVNKLVNNPSSAKQLQSDEQESDVVETWCNEKGKKVEAAPNEGKHEKNPFFDLSSHFPQETNNQQALEAVARKIDDLPSTNNKHQLKTRPIQNLMEKVKREKELAEDLRKKETERIRNVGYKSEKEFLRELDKKNTPLIRQNIPFIMEKYGITRAEAYNLYNLYKSLEKISGSRLFAGNDYRRVQEKGIDRKTFDEGLKGLEINPGEQLIRNICYFPEFITWEEFIKIVSISMRKTPMSKLEALLEGLGNSQDGYLTEQEIDLMVGSSISKIFGREEAELRKHFVGVVMKEMDRDNSGTIDIREIKEYVMKRNLEDMDLITYLMLNN